MPSLSARRHWVLFGSLFVIAAAGAAGALWFGPSEQTASRLDGNLTVLVRPPDRTLEPVSVEEPGSLPVQSGGAMCLDARLNQPAYIYLVWLDAAGKVLPLYPWNNESLEVTDLSQPPPPRRPTNLVFSPLLGRNWTFGDQEGAETVLMMVSHKPLEESTNLAALFNNPPASTAAALDDEPLILTHHNITRAASKLVYKNRRDKKPPPADESLRDLVLRLGDHFELVQAVRFAHKAEKPADNSQGR